MNTKYYKLLNLYFKIYVKSFHKKNFIINKQNKYQKLYNQTNKQTNKKIIIK